MLHRNVVWWEVVRRRLTGLKHAMSARRVGDGDATELDSQPTRDRLEGGRSGVVPHGFLTRAGLDAFGFHDGSIAVMAADANLADHGRALADALEARLVPWVMRSVDGRIRDYTGAPPSPGVVDAARAAGERARAEVGPEIRALLAL